MKLEPLNSGCLKIWLSHTDMHRWGLQFDRMHAQDSATRRTILKLIAVARERGMFGTHVGLTVEALPIDEGCLLLITPHTAPPLPTPEPTVYTVADADALLHLGKALHTIPEQQLPTASLYRWNQEYRLIVYTGTEPAHPYHQLLGEFADRLADGCAAAAYTEEHGERLLVGNAFHTLKASVSRALPPPGPPR